MPVPKEITVPVKKPWFSKTIIANILVALAALFPGTKEFVTGDNIVYLLTALNVLLRLVTKSPVSVFY